MLTDVEFAIYHKILDHSFLQLFVLRISSPFTIKVTDTLPRHLHSAGTTLISILVKNLLSMSDMSPCKKTSLESEHNSKGSLYYTQSSIHTIILVRWAHPTIQYLCKYFCLKQLQIITLLYPNFWYDHTWEQPLLYGCILCVQLIM